MRLTTLAILLAAALVARQAIGADADSATFDSAGTSIAYSVTGSGTPVILIHGLHSSFDMNWKLPGTVKLLAEKYKVIGFDVRGHGRSGKPQDEASYGLQMMEDVTRLMDHLKIEKAHVVGYSMGGMIALKFIAKHPDRVLSGTLGGMGWLREGSPLQESWERLPGRDESRTPEACVHSIGTLALTQDELQGIKAPVSVIVGARDPVRKLYVLPLTRIRPDWPVVEVAGAGHLNCIFKDQFKTAVKAWLDQNAGP